MSPSSDCSASWCRTSSQLSTFSWSIPNRRRQEERPSIERRIPTEKKKKSKGVKKRDNRRGSSATEDVLLPRGSINATQGSVEETSWCWSNWPQGRQRRSWCEGTCQSKGWCEEARKCCGGDTGSRRRLRDFSTRRGSRGL